MVLLINIQGGGYPPHFIKLEATVQFCIFNMKTQIKNFRSGTRNQILNPLIDYSTLPKASSHNGHAGSNSVDVKETWSQVLSENPTILHLSILGCEFYLDKSKHDYYMCFISKVILEDVFKIKASKYNEPYIIICSCNNIEIHNGKNSFRYLCPSLIEIL